MAAMAEAGRGALVLLAGEAGAGKTALARAALAATRFRSLEAASLEAPEPPYRPIASVLRAIGREWGSLLSGQPGLRGYLACVLPELGPQPPSIVRRSGAVGVRETSRPRGAAACQR